MSTKDMRTADNIAMEQLALIDGALLRPLSALSTRGAFRKQDRTDLEVMRRTVAGILAAAERTAFHEDERVALHHGENL